MNLFKGKSLVRAVAHVGIFCVALSGASCGSSQPVSTGSVGGSNSTSGGAVTSGGSLAAGGQSTNGGTQSSVTATSTGGNSMGAGGAAAGGTGGATGGAVAGGGITSSATSPIGGANSGGGTQASGGTSSTGGTRAAGGGTTGGAGASGGTNATSGTQNVGGTVGLGGSSGNTGGTAAGGANASGRSDINFNLDWKYQQGDVTGADAKAFVDSAWTYVDVPHTTKFVTPEDPNAYLGISWYRKHFTVDASAQGSKVFIEFEAAMQLADVWVNGTKKISHQGGYAPFTIDVTSDVTYGGADNVIAVRLDSRSNAAWAPGWDGVDFQYHGGLYRNVSLHVTNALHITDAVYANKVAGGGVFVTYPAVSASSATVHVATHVVNESAMTKSTTVLSELLDNGGQVAGSGTSTTSINAGADASFSHDITVTNPLLWHPNTPNLYTLRSTVKDGSAAVDQTTTRIGIRRIQWTHAGGLSINGTRFKALGVNLHQETYGLGNAIPNQAMYYEVKRIKEGGSDFIRGSHYPHAPAFYDACDALGVLVLNAQTGWQQFNDTTAFKNATYQELRDMIRRDRNHPSVVAWEASLNESNFTDAWAQMANSIVHDEYPGDQAYSGQWIISTSSTPRSDIALGASQSGVRTSADSRPIIVDEFSDWDFGGASSTSRQKREDGDTAMLTQANNIQTGLSNNLALSWFSAGAYWDYADYGGFSNYGITRCGMVDMYRLPKHSYYLQQSQRDPNVSIAGIDTGPMVYIANQWTATSPTTVRVYSNCDQVSLYLNNTLVKTQSPDTGTQIVHPPFNFAVGTFTSGALRADCSMAGAVKASFTRQTPGAATAIRLRPEATTLLADASDARLVFVDVVDTNGSVVPSNAGAVTVQVTGAGSIVGPTSITMKGGQLATWVRSTRTAGTITLTASASGLTDGVANLTSQAVPGLPALPQGR